ncbi:hypothetical protein ID866_11907 [Astraeus odoratus]|nr:hypothetical protein ID866_11907 [Astraeus odoratus]
MPEVDVGDGGDAEDVGEFVIGATPGEEEAGENADPSIRSTEDGIGIFFGTLACREADRSISAANGETSGL